MESILDFFRDSLSIFHAGFCEDLLVRAQQSIGRRSQRIVVVFEDLLNLLLDVLETRQKNGERGSLSGGDEHVLGKFIEQFQDAEFYARVFIPPPRN